MPKTLNTTQFLQELNTYRPPEKQKKPGQGPESFGVPMRKIFALAKEFMDMPPEEIEELLESPVHEARLGAVSIMDWQARSKKTSEARRKELFDLYMRRHDRINNWDLVDRSAPYVIGRYLFNKPRKILYKLARSKNLWERRTAIVSTYYFIRQGDLDDTFKIAEILIHDEEDLVQKAVGGWVREAGKKDRQKLLDFLDKYAASMPRTTLRYAIEHLDRTQKDYYMGSKKSNPAP
jgi:3-methyladenine DNA glycosylase AlkD